MGQMVYFNNKLNLYWKKLSPVGTNGLFYSSFRPERALRYIIHK